MKDKESLFKKIKNIIKRVLSVQTVGLMIMAPGSEANEQKEKIYDNTEQTTTSFKDDLQVPTTQEELTKILEGEVTESETKVNRIDNQKSEENTTLVQQEIEETTINNNVNEDLLYNRLLEKFNEKTSKNNFSGMSYKYLKSFLDNVYENYNGWHQTNKDLPNKETYIIDNIINVLDKEKDIQFIKYDSKEYKEEIENKNRGLAYTDRDFVITVVYNYSV